MSNYAMAKRSISETDWYIHISVGGTIHIEKDLLHDVSKLLIPAIRESEGEPEPLGEGEWYMIAPQEVFNQYRQFKRLVGKPSENPAHGEYFLRLFDNQEPLPMIFTTVDGKVYATGKEMFPF